METALLCFLILAKSRFGYFAAFNLFFELKYILIIKHCKNCELKVRFLSKTRQVFHSAFFLLSTLKDFIVEQTIRSLDGLQMVFVF